MQKFQIKNLMVHFSLILVSLLCIFPFLWLLSTALKGSGENIFQYPPQLIPTKATLANFKSAWTQIPFLTYYINSFIVAFFTVILNLILSSLAAYPLARMEFRGKKIIFYAIMVDTVNNFMGFLGLILPFAVNAFGIFLMRQAFMAIPRELEEAAFVDGCNIFQIWYKILIPMVKPTLATLAIFTFIGSWGEFLWPSIVLTNKAMYTLPVGVNDLQGMFSANWRIIAAGSLISIIPIIIFFLALQRYFISGENEGAVKG